MVGKLNKSLLSGGWFKEVGIAGHRWYENREEELGVCGGVEAWMEMEVWEKVG